MQSDTSATNKENNPPSQSSGTSQISGANPSSEVSQANQASEHDDTTTTKLSENSNRPDHTTETPAREPSVTAGASPEPRTRPQRPTLQRSTPQMSLLLQSVDVSNSSSQAKTADRSISPDAQAYLKKARNQARQLRGCYPPSPPQMPWFLANLMREPPLKVPRKTLGEKIREKPNWDHLLNPQAGKQAQKSPAKRKADGDWQRSQTRKRKNAISEPKMTRTPDPKAAPLRIDEQGRPLSPDEFRGEEFPEPAPPVRIDDHGRPVSPPPYSYSDPNAQFTIYDLPSRPVVRLPPSNSYTSYDETRDSGPSSQGRPAATARRAYVNTQTNPFSDLSVDAAVRNGAPVDEVYYVEDYDPGF